MRQILVVDDNISILKQISAHLAGIYDVSLAKSGPLALQICAREKPDLILLDIEMPDMDGFEVLAQLKQNPGLCWIPVIFLTASREAAIEAKALVSGAKDFIVKPVEKTILLHRVDIHLRFSSYQIKAEVTVKGLADSIVTTFAELIECRDINDNGHVKRVAKITALLGRELIQNGCYEDELNEEELQIIVRASPLHDVGKIAISDQIIMKGDSLNDEEFDIMKRHTSIGAEILERMYHRAPGQHYLRYASIIAACHHERWDGKGYPRGLAETGIPICGRLVALADVYDILIKNQVYRGAIRHIDASEIIIKGKGGQFDPRITEAFEKIKDTLPGILEEEV
jgi:putative two-component system response regulator